MMGMDPSRIFFTIHDALSLATAGRINPWFGGNNCAVTVRRSRPCMPRTECCNWLEVGMRCALTEDQLAPLPGVERLRLSLRVLAMAPAAVR